MPWDSLAGIREPKIATDAEGLLIETQRFTSVTTRHGTLTPPDGSDSFTAMGPASFWVSADGRALTFTLRARSRSACESADLELVGVAEWERSRWQV